MNPVLPNLASCFLSHCKKDNTTLVQEVADYLGHFGVIPWIDEEELVVGERNCESYIQEVIRKQTVFVVFLYRACLNDSYWVREELEVALEAEKSGKYHSLIPVFMENEMDIVSNSDLLKSYGWLSEDHRRVVKIGIDASSNQDPAYIAKKISDRICINMNLKKKSKVNLIFDQRGNSEKRVGVQGIKHFLEFNPEAPTLVFRYDREKRKTHDFLSGLKYDQFRNHLTESLPHNSVPSSEDGKFKVYIYGDFQLSLGYFIGHFYNKNNVYTDLHCYNRYSKDYFTNTNQKRKGILNTDSVNRLQEQNITGVSNSEVSTLAFYVGSSNSKYIDQVEIDIRKKNVDILARIIDDEFINNSEQAMKLVEEVVAAIYYLRETYKINEIRFYTSLPSALMPLIGANLTEHVISKVKFMDKDMKSDSYVYIPLD